jgi:ABC-type multidrug transport system ATPase subunit
MDLVAERKHSGVRTGRIFYGDATCVQSKQDVAYVQSSDVHIGEFTVAQNLYFSALLRLGCGLSEAELRSRCEEAAAAVGLSGAMDVKVGTELIKGISGGQKKRLSVATELLALPSVMCLDEPTTGT